MAYLNASVLDNGLSQISSTGNRLDICRTQPTTFTEAASTFSLGNKTGLVIPSPVAMTTPPGRRVVVPAITDGVVSVTSTGTTDDAEFWAITDTVNSVLLAAGPLSSPDLVTAGDGFTLNSFHIGFPSPT